MRDLVVLDVGEERLEAELAHEVDGCAVDGSGGDGPQLTVSVV